MTLVRTITAGLLASAALLPALTSADAAALELTKIGEFRTGVFDESAAEIPAFDPASKRLFVVNGDSKGIDILDLTDPTAPSKLGSLDLSPFGGAANSVSVVGGVVGVAVQGETKQDLGTAAFFDVEGNALGHTQVGALPDMITITKNGQTALVANEGEPNDDYSIDPEGSISIIDLSQGLDSLSVKTVTLEGWTQDQLTNGARLAQPDLPSEIDFEPEYIVTSADGATAWVAMQENNAIAIVDVVNARLTGIAGAGLQDHSVVKLDASNRDDRINLANWPVLGMAMPDSLYAVEIGGETYILTANEGDSRDYDAFSEEERVADITLDPTAFPNAEELQKDENLGRLKISTTIGDTDGDGDFDQLYAYGARSFSIMNASGAIVWDSGSQFEEILAERHPDDFNSNNDENNSFDARSDDKGPEPEAVTAGVVGDATYAFIGLERIGGIMVYDITDPTAPSFVDYVTTRKFDGDPEADTAGDLGPEGLVFIPAADSPNGENLLVVANEVSGSTAIFSVK